MLSEEQFDRMRGELLEKRARLRASGLESLEAAIVEGIVPSVSDHKLENYILRIEQRVNV